MGIADIFDNILGTNTSDDVRDLQNLYGDIDLPDFEFDGYNMQGDTAFGGITEDTNSLAAQQQALEKMTQVMNQGFSDEDLANQYFLKNQINQNDQARQQALAQKFAQQGTLGQGSQQAQAMMNQQSSAQNQALTGMELAGQGARNRQNAMGQVFGMGSGMRDQDYGRQADKAAARDSISRFNTTNQNRGMDTRNQLAQNTFDSRLNRASGQAGGYQASIQDKAGKRNALMNAGSSALRTGGQLLPSLLKGGGLRYVSTTTTNKRNARSCPTEFTEWRKFIRPWP